jgi:hypothetical protein
MRPAHLVLALVTLAAAAVPARAQELQPGTRVRISAPIIRSNSRFTGRVMSDSSGRVVLRLDPTIQQDTREDTISIPRNLIRRVEVSTGQVPKSRAPAARAGAVAGLLGGVAVGLVIGGEVGSSAGNRNPWMTVLWTAPLGIVAGAGTGALIGAAPHEQWRVVRPPRVSALSARADGRGVRLGVRVGI